MMALQGIDGLARVLGALAGDTSAPLMARLVTTAAAERRAAELAALVADCRLQALAARLPPAAAARIARAPLFAGLVQMCVPGDGTAEPDGTPDAASRALLAGWISAELALLGAAAPEGATLWTALGDAAFLPGKPVYLAPTLWGVVVDTCSPYVAEAPFLPPPVRARPRRQANPAASLTALRTAMDVLATAHQPSADFAVLSLVTLALYDTPGNTASFSSSSSRNFPGAAALSNVATSEMDCYRLADSVLHEAVHAFLYAVEGLIPLFRPGSRHEPTVISPWTGVRLPLHAFVHACFVWMALLVFWRRAEDAAGLQAERAAALAARAGTGFAGGALEQAIAQVRSRITPEAEAALGQLVVRAAALL